MTPIKHRGAQAELTACAWLLSQGYEVFRNVSQHGVVDLVAIHPENGETILVDVRTINSYINTIGETIIYANWNKKMESPLPIKILGFDPRTLECNWIEPKLQLSPLERYNKQYERDLAKQRAK